MNLAQTNKQSEIERVNVLGVGISVLNLDTAEELLYEGVRTPGFSGYVTVTGVHGVVESQSDLNLKKIHNNSYLSTPDGMPMVWLGRLYGYETMDRVYGPELMLNIMEDRSKNGYRHYFFGGDVGVADELKSKLTNKYKGLNVVGTKCPPFRALTDEENDSLFDELQRLQPEFLWVGLSTPKQERFMHGFLSKYPNLTKDWGHGLIMLGVGAAFDFHSGRVKQAPYWIQRSGFEWLYRTVYNPRKLFRRYFVANTQFCIKIIPQIFGWMKYRMNK